MKGARELWIASLLAAGSLSVSFGATFALFTSSSSVDVKIATAKISLTPVLSLHSASSNGVSATVESNHATFVNGNQISVENGEVSVGLTPGDYFTLNVEGLNSSNINIKYRGYIKVASDQYGLAPYLAYSYTGFSNIWTDAAKSDSETYVDSGAKITIGLPAGITGDWTGKSVDFKVGYEAVQGNADLANGYTSYALSAAESPFAFNVVEPMSGLRVSGVSNTSNAQIGLYVAPAVGETSLSNKVAYQVTLSGQKPESNTNVTVPYQTGQNGVKVYVYIGGSLISSTYDSERGLVSFSSDSLGLIEIGQ